MTSGLLDRRIWTCSGVEGQREQDLMNMQDEPQPNRGVPATGDLILTAFGEVASVFGALMF